MGRPWPKPGEPLFTDDDTEEILDYLALEDATCDGCGQLKVESFDASSEGTWSVTALRCHACAARERSSGDYGPNEHGGLYFAVSRDAPKGGSHG